MSGIGGLPDVENTHLHHLLLDGLPGLIVLGLAVQGAVQHFRAVAEQHLDTIQHMIEVNWRGG